MGALGDEYISTEHLLLALTDDSSGVADVLPDRATLMKAVAEVRGPHRVTSTYLQHLLVRGVLFGHLRGGGGEPAAPRS